MSVPLYGHMMLYVRSPVWSHDALCLVPCMVTSEAFAVGILVLLLGDESEQSSVHPHTKSTLTRLGVCLLAHEV